MERLVCGSEFLFSGCRALLAGDSNVHRLKRVAKVMDAQIDCLPISGAKYTTNRKMFREQLQTCLKDTCYRRLYLFLGSNDISADDDLFYRNVAGMLDLVHETSPWTEVVVCEILQRGLDHRKMNSTTDLKRMQKWIENANQTLVDICSRTRYARYLGRRGFQTACHLSADGLHLSEEGAELCFRVITDDSTIEPISQTISSSYHECTDDWPVVGVPTEIVQDSRTSYADIVREKKEHVQVTKVCTPRTRPKEEAVKEVFRRPQRWIQCPECCVQCSRDDFLVDHVIRKHVKTGSPAAVETDEKTDSPACLEATDEKMDSPTALGTTEENNVQSSTDTEQRRNLPTTCADAEEEDVNISRLRLLLSNDVEQNPGPVVRCNWAECGAMFTTVGECDVHVIAHVAKEQCCKWKSCQFKTAGLMTLELHAIEHVYDSRELFPSFDDWISTLPDGKFSDTMTLHYVPKHVRSKLKILLFDEEFELPPSQWSADKHREYLEFLSSSNPSDFNFKSREFLEKRKSLGEEWSNYLGKDILCREIASTSSSVSNHPRSFYVVQSDTKYDTVQTTRPELVSRYNLGTQLKSQNVPKRKHESSENNQYLNLDESTIPWLKTLIYNLALCRKAITTQRDILNKMKEISMIESTNQKFLLIEQEAAKLASLENCTSGTFVCFIFKYLANEEEIFYIRYLESGCFSGFLHQNFIDILKEKYTITDNNCLINNVYTREDLNDMRQVADRKNNKRNRPDKIRSKSISNVSVKVDELKNITSLSETTDLKLESLVINLWPHKTKTSAGCPESPYLESSDIFGPDLKQNFVDFRLHRLSIPAVTSRDLLDTEISNDTLSLFQQSVHLNCLSSDIKREKSKHLFKRPGRFEANFLLGPNMTSSLRNHILVLYLEKDFQTLYSFLDRYITCDNATLERSEQNDDFELPCAKKQKKTSHPVKSISIDRKDLERKLKRKTSVDSFSADSDPISLFDSYCFQLLQHGKLSIQFLSESGNVVCIMNDYSATDGSFRETEFVQTSKFVHETGSYFQCTCQTYSTLLEIQDNDNRHDFIVLDSAGENCVTCMHCKFLSLHILSILEAKSKDSTSHLSTFVQNAVKDKGKEIVELVRNDNTRKFSIMLVGESQPTFVHVTFSSRIKKYIFSCLNGLCLSKRGHKRTIDTFESNTACKHLSVLRNHLEHWHDLKNNEPTVSDFYEEIEMHDPDIDFISLGASSNFTENENNFDEKTGLWQFKCKSTHKPSERGDEILKSNLQKRDSWSDNNLKRDQDGCLIGPDLFPDIPDNTCECGKGWLMRVDDENYDENGRILNDNGRICTIYTSFAPVKCKIYNRICYNQDSPCKILWDEGRLDSVHVLSRDTAAGDEIGWEFVSMVMNSGCTFGSYCKLKNELYQIRNARAKFMDATVYLKWWFSWAANMKIDFRQSCDVCGCKPKRLCCDGTEVGVGFRHANFEEIEKVNLDVQENQTLHRRMSRCFLKNQDEISVPEMLENRKMLDYLARETLGELKPQEFLTPEDRQSKILVLRQALPRDFLSSFDRFFPYDTVCDRQEDEKVCFATVMKMLATTASVTSLLPPKNCHDLQRLLEPHIEDETFNYVMNEMRYYAPELRDLIAQSLASNNSIDGHLEDYITLLLRYLINQSVNMSLTEPEQAVPQPGSYNPSKYGRAYYFNKFGLKLRNVRKFSIDKNRSAYGNDHDDAAHDFEKCQKQYSKGHISARGTTSLFLWFCADHGHCYGFHMTYAEGRKDPSASLYSYLEDPPTDIFYDFACNLQEYCLNRESGYYRDVRFFHDIFHGYAHKCSSAFRSKRLRGFESVNSEICEQFNSFLQNIKKSARQMTQEHFCFYLQFFLHQWNLRKRASYQNKIKVALAGLH